MSFKDVLQKMRRCVEEGRCKPKPHAFDEMWNDSVDFEDVKCAIRNGSIKEKQWDKKYQEWKYLIYGRTTDRCEIVVVAKIGAAGDTIVITVYKT